MSLIRVIRLNIFGRRNSGILLKTDLSSCGKALFPCLSYSSIDLASYLTLSCGNCMLDWSVDTLRSLFILSILLALKWFWGAMSVEFGFNIINSWLSGKCCRVSTWTTGGSRGFACNLSLISFQVACQCLSFLLLSTLSCRHLFLAVWAFTSWFLLALKKTGWCLLSAKTLKVSCYYLRPI